MSKKVAIIQSCYIPWKGYFDLINTVDEFILFDDVQYTRRDWRNRNKIKTPNGLMWLTIPVKTKGERLQKVKDTEISDPQWNQKHWKSIIRNYSRAKNFQNNKEFFEDLYLGTNERFLSRINYRFISGICVLLGIETKISWSMDYSIVDGKTERLVELCRQAGATEYLSGPAAKVYIDEEQFRNEGIALQYFDYSDYSEYGQMYPPFEHEVSIIDLIFNEGLNATTFLKSFGTGGKFVVP